MVTIWLQIGNKKLQSGYRRKTGRVASARAAKRLIVQVAQNRPIVQNAQMKTPFGPSTAQAIGARKGVVF